MNGGMGYSRCSECMVKDRPEDHRFHCQPYEAVHLMKITTVELSETSSSSTRHRGSKCRSGNGPNWTFSGIVIVTCLSQLVIPTYSLVADGVCPLQRCWERYQDDLEAAGLQDDLMWSDSVQQRQLERLKPRRARLARRLCQVMLAYDSCTRLAHHRCVGNLKYHSVRRRIERNLHQLDCHSNSTHSTTPNYDLHQMENDEGPDKSAISRDLEINSDKIDETKNCGFRSVSLYKYCSVFGDPHVRTFEGKFQTCNVRGTRPMFDNEYVTIQITNGEVSGPSGTGVNGTAIEQLTVVIKQYSPCGPEHYVTYQAQYGQLPLTFDDGRTRVEGVELFQHPPPDDHIEINLRYANIFILIRLITHQSYTVGVAVPDDLLSSHDVTESDQSARLQLCQMGCAKDELIDVDKILTPDIPRKSTRTVLQRQKADETGVKLSSPSLSTANARCRELALTGYYFKSCLFDLLTTGDVIFAAASRDAAMDAFRFVGRSEEIIELMEDNKDANQLHEVIVTNSCRQLIMECQIFTMVYLLLLTALTLDCLSFKFT